MEYRSAVAMGNWTATKLCRYGDHFFSGHGLNHIGVFRPYLLT